MGVVHSVDPSARRCGIQSVNVRSCLRKKGPREGVLRGRLSWGRVTLGHGSVGLTRPRLPVGAEREVKVNLADYDSVLAAIEQWGLLYLVETGLPQVPEVAEREPGVVY